METVKVLFCLEIATNEFRSLKETCEIICNELIEENPSVQDAIFAFEIKDIIMLLPVKES